MKFTRVAAVVGLAAAAYAKCGTQCTPGKKPNGVLKAEIQKVAYQDLQMGYGYEVGGTVVINDDCNFSVENFYVFPQVGNAFWTCNLNGSGEGISLTKPGTVNAVDPSNPQTFNYNVESAPDGFCYASLLEDCYDFQLLNIIEENGQQKWQTIAKASAVNKSASGSSGSSGSSSSGKSGKSGKSGSTSDAKTTKWGMGLIGLSSLAAYLLA